MKVKRLSEFLTCGDFGRTRQLSVSAIPRVCCHDSFKALQRHDDQAYSVRDTVNRVGGGGGLGR